VSNGLDFREYVMAYTNAAAILRDDFADTEDLDGLFSGFDPQARRYDPSTWAYERAEASAAAGERDPATDAESGGVGANQQAGGRDAGDGGGPGPRRPPAAPPPPHPRPLYPAPQPPLRPPPPP